MTIAPAAVLRRRGDAPRDRARLLAREPDDARLPSRIAISHRHAWRRTARPSSCVLKRKGTRTVTRSPTGFA
jgi:hypothetical protein